MTKSVIFVKSQVFLPINGAEISMFERLQCLRTAFNWNTKAICCAHSTEKDALLTIIKKVATDIRQQDNSIDYKIRDIPVELHFHLNPPEDQESFLSFASKLVKPGCLLLSNLRDYPASYLCSKLGQDKTVYFMTENEFPTKDRIKNLPDADKIERIYKSAQHVVVASDFLKESLFSAWQIKAEKFTNCIDIEKYKTIKDHNREYISMLHPYSHKGVDLFLEIARKMPSRKFLLLGGTGKEYRDKKPIFNSIPNLTLLPFQPDVRPIYARSRLVLVPSIWEEAFSRVIVEALASDVPVIAFDRGGMTEAGGKAAQYIQFNPNSVDDWISAIESLDDPDRYNQCLINSRIHIEEYSEDLQKSMQLMNSWFLKLIEESSGK